MKLKYTTEPREQAEVIFVQLQCGHIQSKQFLTWWKASLIFFTRGQYFFLVWSPFTCVGQNWTYFLGTETKYEKQGCQTDFNWILT